MKRLFLSFVCFSTSSLALMANGLSIEDNNTADTTEMHKVQLDDVVVNAAYARSVASHAPLNTSYDKQALFGIQGRTMPETLQGMTGVWVQQTDHGGGSPIIRGMIGYQTIMLVDGIRLNNAAFQSGPLPYLNTIDGMMMERVDVVPGAASVAYGSDAMGGVIYMQSQSAPFTDTSGFVWHGNVAGRAQTSGMEYTGRIEQNISNRVWAIHVGVDGKRFGDVHAGKGLGIEHPSGYTEWAGDVKVKRKIGDYSILTAAYQGKRQYHIPTFLQIQSGKYDKYETMNQARDLGYLAYAFRPESKLLKYWEASLSYARLNTVTCRIPHAKNVASYNTNDVRSTGLVSDVGLEPFTWMTLKAGADVYRDKIYSHAEKADLDQNTQQTAKASLPDGSSMLSYAAFAEAEAAFGRLKAGAGARYSGHQLHLSTNDFGEVTLKPHAFVVDFHVAYEVLPHFTMAYIMATSFRAPNINDLAKLGAEDSWYFVPNYRLSPERGFNKELSLKFDNGDTRFSVNLYHNALSNMMALVSGKTEDGRTEVDGAPVRMRSNVEEAYIMGAEAAVEQQLGRYFSVKGNMTYTYGENKTENIPLSKIPPLFGTISVNYRHHRLSMSLTGEWACKQTRLSSQDKEDARIPKGGTPGWMAFSLNATYEFWHVKLAGTWGNIFNKAYRYHASGIDAPGMNAKLTVTYSY